MRNGKLKILHLEDLPADVELVDRELKKAGLLFDKVVTDNKEGFTKMVKEFDPDIILSDHSLPSFNSTEALTILKENNIKTPFILITSTISEEFAVDIMKRGAWDYILKDRLQRLPSAVLNVIEKFDIENERKQFLDKIIANEALLKEAEKMAHFGSWQVDMEKGITTWSEELYRLLGYEVNEIEASYENFLRAIYSDDLPEVLAITQKARAELNAVRFDFRVITKDGFTRYIHSEQIIKRKPNGDLLLIKGFNLDITEMKLAKQEVENAHFQLNNLLHTVEEGVFSMDTVTHKYVYFSSAFEKIYGYAVEDFFSNVNLWYDVIVTEDKYIADRGYKELHAGSQANMEFRILHKNKTIRWLNCRIIPQLDKTGVLVRIEGVVNDNTEKKLAEEALTISELNYRTLVEQAPVGIFVLNNEGEFINVNTSACTMTGYGREEIRRMRLSDIILKDDLEKNAIRFSELQVGTTLIRERKFVRRDASVIAVEMSGTMLPNGLYQVICHDVTERRKNEEDLKGSREELRKLASHLQDIREEERADMAREIHDELGQLLTALRFNISRIRSGLTGKDTILNEKINESIELVDTTIKTVRKIASELRPPILDEFGLAAALEWQNNQFASRTGIKCFFTCNNPEIVLSKGIAIGLFRVYQESLTNVARHSGATEVYTSFTFMDDHIVLSVKDNGHGFNIEEIKSKNRLGLIGMKERLKIMDGELIIESAPEQGTCLTVRVSFAA
jgi:PAS domain S-box-containing protein